ncbi:sigma-70 family RNA polymerase sigma factor [Spirillospora sp. NPDC047279]|uniref:sigma-70 family RNA polymerase sigma factor n=1 Tax=Spirillospora sp. NPDC047279 TaxID=3155478 RepID=UPI0033D38794
MDDRSAGGGEPLLEAVADGTELDLLIKRHQTELTGYCYRMLGSAFDADDAVQETMVRAWKSLDRFEGRSSLRTWLYRIATNVCLDMLAGGRRRARPMDLSGPSSGASGPGEPWAADRLIEPVPDDRITGHGSRGTDPADVAVGRESVQLAFVAALQHLPSTQRSVLLLREVLGLSAREIAELQYSSVPSVNSALQRARATLAARRGEAGPPAAPVSDDLENALVERYVDAFERFDMEALSLILHVDATLCLPPHPVWMKGPDAIQAWLLGPGVGCRGSRLIRTVANGCPAFGQYRPSTGGDGFAPFALQVVEIVAGRVAAIHSFRDTDRLFPLFGLPPRVDA